MEKRELSVTQEEPKDVLYSLVKGIVDITPVIGGILSELFGYIIPAPVDKRRAEWMIMVSKSIHELQENEGFDISSLSDNEMFITAIIKASQIAQRTHQEEKITALRNAVINSARGIDLEDSIQLIFLNHIDVFTPIHLIILKFFHGPMKWAEENHITYPQWGQASVGKVLEKGIPELEGRRELYDYLVDDLSNKGLMMGGSSGLHALTTGSSAFSKKTVPLGDSFLQYIGLL